MIINYNDACYVVQRIMPRTAFKSEIDADILKEWSYCDTILQRDDLVYFCNTISDVEFVEE